MRVLLNMLFLLFALVAVFWLSRAHADQVAVAHVVAFSQDGVRIVVNPFEDLTAAECALHLKEFKLAMKKHKRVTIGKTAQCQVKIVTREQA